MSIFSKKKEISINEFAAGLAIAFNRMRASNIETLKKFLPEMIGKMSKDELMKLDWELSIFDIFNITNCCHLLIEDEEICYKILDFFHKYIYEEFLKTSPLVVAAFQNESKIKYETYSNAINSPEPIWNLCKEVWKNILGKPCESLIEIKALSIYFEGNQRYIAEYFKNMMKEFEFADKWKARKDLIKSLGFPRVKKAAELKKRLIKGDGSH